MSRDDPGVSSTFHFISTHLSHQHFDPWQGSPKSISKTNFQTDSREICREYSRSPENESNLIFSTTPCVFMWLLHECTMPPKVPKAHLHLSPESSPAQCHIICFTLCCRSILQGDEYANECLLRSRLSRSGAFPQPVL